MCAINVIFLYLLERRLNTTLSSNLAGHLGSSVSGISEDPSRFGPVVQRSFGFSKPRAYEETLYNLGFTQTIPGCLWFTPSLFLEVWKSHYFHDTHRPLDPQGHWTLLPKTNLLDKWIALPACHVLTILQGSTKSRCLKEWNMLVPWKKSYVKPRQHIKK